MDGDGEQETAAVFLRVTSAEEQPMRVCLFRQGNGREEGDHTYRQVHMLSGEGNSINSVAYEDLTGDGSREIIVSWQLSGSSSAVTRLTDSGVLFIPAHLVQEVVDGAVKTKVKDMFGFEMITRNKFTTAQIDKNVWTVEMLDLLMEYIDTNEAAADFRGIDWSQEYDLAVNGDPNDTQSAL